MVYPHFGEHPFTLLVVRTCSWWLVFLGRFSLLKWSATELEAYRWSHTLEASLLDLQAEPTKKYLRKPEQLWHSQHRTLSSQKLGGLNKTRLVVARSETEPDEVTTVEPENVPSQPNEMQ